ncbi:MAG: inorganic phosphate transporter [Candidatus Bathyarchaeia archaeon]
MQKMLNAFTLLILTVIIALIFDLANGWHDGANSISVIVYTGGLRPHPAVVMSAIFNFVGPFVVGTTVAKTIGTEVIPEGKITTVIILAALISAITWDILTWVWGLPVSSSHALIGGLVGAGVASYGIHGVKWYGLIEKVIIPLATSPLIGLFIGFLAMKGLSKLKNKFSNPNKLDKYFNHSQIPLAAFLSLSHGANDAQKTMGIIAMVLAAYYAIPFHVPMWVMVSCAMAMAVGTYLDIKIWRIVKTLGEKVTHLEPIHGCSANLSSSLIIFLASLLGAPVSTTHVVTSSIAGVGVASGLSRVNWRVFRDVILAWVTTLPFCIGFSALTYISLIKIFHF